MLIDHVDGGSRDYGSIAEAVPGSRIWFEGERMPYTVQARSERYLVCTKPFAPRKTVIYTVVDLKEKVRGTENLVFCAGFETKELCEEAIERLTGKCKDTGFQTEVSHRNRVPLTVVKFKQP